jgi:hypothetical protein
MDSQLIAAIVGGLIGIAGSIATLVASHFLRISGKIIVDVTESKVHLYLRDLGSSGDRETDLIDNAEVLDIGIGIDIYNSADIPRSLREIQVELRTKDKKRILMSHPEIFHVIKSDVSPFASGYRKLELINLPSKELQHINFRSVYKRPKINGLKGPVDFYLKALYPSGGKFRTHLFTTALK